MGADKCGEGCGSSSSCKSQSESMTVDMVTRVDALKRFSLSRFGDLGRIDRGSTLAQNVASITVPSYSVAQQDSGTFYTPTQVKQARLVTFSGLLDHLGAQHKVDPEYHGTATKRRVLVGLSGKEFRFIFSGYAWFDERGTGHRKAHSGKGAVDFVIYVTGDTVFPHAVRTCLAAAKLPEMPEGGLPDAQHEFPYWPADARAMANEVFRSALFNARNKNVPRRVWRASKPAIIAVLGDGVIEYVGEELRQIEAKVWMQVIHLARMLPPGTPVEFVAAAFCRAIKWPTNKNSYEQLIICLGRMQANSLRIASARLGRGVSLSMIPRFEYMDEATGQRLRRWRVTLAADLVLLFGGQHVSWLEWQQRLALPDGIATWLHCYYSTHRSPKPETIKDLASGAGLASDNLATLRDSIRRGLDALQKVGFLKSYRIAKGKIYVERAKNDE